MKKIAILFSIVILIVLLNATTVKAQTIEMSPKLSEESYEIFDKLYKRDEVLNNGDIYIDFMNTKNRDTIDVFGKTVEIDFVTNLLRGLSDAQRKELISQPSKNLSTSKKNEIFMYVDSIGVNINTNDQTQYKELLTEDFVNLLIEEYQPDEILDDRIESQRASTSYYWFATYYGANQYFDSNYTYYGNYYQYCQYYKSFIQTETLPWGTPRTSDKYVLYETTPIPYGSKLGETTAYKNTKPYDFYDISTLRYYVYKPGFLGIGKKHEIYSLYKEVDEYQRVYTGVYYYGLAGNPQRYSHQQKISFNYKSYNLAVLQAPQASITLILDYFGEQKMILVSTDPEIGAYSFYITQEVHYNRNTYQKNDFNCPLTIYYSTLGSILNSGAPWVKASNVATYFHRLLNNPNNVKYHMPVVYYDGTLDVYTKGEYELVYNGLSNEALVVTDPFLAGTFNFGNEYNFENGTGLVNDSHYIRDVYPYLIWGNSLADYQNHSPFERFVWDKDSANPPFPYQGINLSGYSLTSLYPNSITDEGGTEIPESVQNGSVLF